MERSKSREHCGKVLAAFNLMHDGKKVSTEILSLVSGLTEKQVEAAIEAMSRGKHPQVAGDRSGIEQVNEVKA